MRLLLALSLVALLGCGDVNDRTCRRLQRQIATGVIIPPTVVDRMTVGCAGSLLREVDGKSTRGRWEEDGSIVSLVYPASTWTGSAQNTTACLYAPGWCLILDGEGVHDLYETIAP